MASSERNRPAMDERHLPCWRERMSVDRMKPKQTSSRQQVSTPERHTIDPRVELVYLSEPLLAWVGFRRQSTQRRVRAVPRRNRRESWLDAVQLGPGNHVGDVVTGIPISAGATQSPARVDVIGACQDHDHIRMLVNHL